MRPIDARSRTRLRHHAPRLTRAETAKLPAKMWKSSAVARLPPAPNLELLQNAEGTGAAEDRNRSSHANVDLVAVGNVGQRHLVIVER